MTKYLFPEDRSAFVYGPANTPILSSAGNSLIIFLDPDTSILADIEDLDGNPIPGSVVVVGEDSLMPYFRGPENIYALYAQPEASALNYRVNCVISDLLNHNPVGQGGGFGNPGQPRFHGDGPPGPELFDIALPGDGYLDNVTGLTYWKRLGDYMENPVGSGQPRFAGVGLPNTQAIPALANDIYLDLVTGKAYRLKAGA